MTFYRAISAQCKSGHGGVKEGLRPRNPLLLIGMSSPCSDVNGFPLSLAERSFTISLTPYDRKKNVLSVSLNKHTSFCL